MPFQTGGYSTRQYGTPTSALRPERHPVARREGVGSPFDVTSSVGQQTGLNEPAVQQHGSRQREYKPNGGLLQQRVHRTRTATGRGSGSAFAQRATSVPSTSNPPHLNLFTRITRPLSTHSEQSVLTTGGRAGQRPFQPSVQQPTRRKAGAMGQQSSQHLISGLDWQQNRILAIQEQQTQQAGSVQARRQELEGVGEKHLTPSQLSRHDQPREATRSQGGGQGAGRSQDRTTAQNTEEIVGRSKARTMARVIEERNAQINRSQETFNNLSALTQEGYSRMSPALRESTRADLQRAQRSLDHWYPLTRGLKRQRTR